MKLPADRVAVKICGLTNREDAVAAVEAGADLLGFNTWQGSRRYISLDENSVWIAELPVLRVALLVNAPLEDAARIAGLSFVDALQLHGDEDAAYCAQVAAFGKPIIKALRAKDAGSLDQADGFSTKHLLIDGWVSGEFGGTGVRPDSSLVDGFRQRFPGLVLWLAGGLTPDNVADAVTLLEPAVVDVSSGVEREPKMKDFAKMRRFVAAAAKMR